MVAASEPVTTRLFEHQPATVVDAGDAIFVEGDDSDSLYVVKSGRIEIRRDGAQVATMGSGEIFGEMSLVDDLPRSAQALASERSELIVVPQSQFDFLVANTPGFAQMVMRTLAHRLRLTAEAAT